MTKRILLISALCSLCAVANDTAYFAGGCFWSMQKFFDHVSGVVDTRVGYSGGKLANPTYSAVSTGTTEHRETIEVTFDPKKTSYEKLIDAYFHDIDPTDPAGEFCDHGSEYISAIFYKNDAEKKIVEAEKKKINDSKVLKKPVVTDLLLFKKFWPGEEEHQKYYQKHSVQYGAYRMGCRRDSTLKDVWGKLAQ